MPSVRTSSAGHHSLGKRPSCCRTRGRGALTPNWRCNCVIVCARKLVLEREGRKPASFNAWAIAVAAQPASVNSCTGLPDLRIGTQLAQLANRSDHNPLGVTSSNPLDTYPDPSDNLAHDLFAIGIGGGRSGPKHGNICRQAANRLPFGFVSSRRG